MENKDLDDLLDDLKILKDDLNTIISKVKDDLNTIISKVKEKPKKVEKIRIGQEYEFCSNGEVYRLINVGRYSVLLINIKDFSRWTDYVKVNDVYDISKEEWTILTGGKKFNLINV